MIGRIKGILADKQATEVLVDVNGVGYEVQIPMSTLFQLPETGKEVLLHTHFVVREDAQSLYGFYDQEARTLFRLLIRINGVGPKVALAILSSMEVGEFVAAVHQDDVGSLLNVPGIGKKTAQRLLIEMRDKLKDWGGGETVGDMSGQAPGTGASVLLQDAEAALLSLGYKPQEASRAVSAAARQLEGDGDPLSSETLLRLALKNMGN